MLRNRLAFTSKLVTNVATGPSANSTMLDTWVGTVLLTVSPTRPLAWMTRSGMPMRAAAITSWVLLFPDNVGQMAAFGFVQHNFFVLFNALLGLLFWPRARRELLDQ